MRRSRVRKLERSLQGSFFPVSANDQTEATAGAGVDVESAERVGVKIEHVRHRAPAVASSALFGLGCASTVMELMDGLRDVICELGRPDKRKKSRAVVEMEAECSSAASSQSSWASSPYQSRPSRTTRIQYPRLRRQSCENAPNSWPLCRQAAEQRTRQAEHSRCR